MSARNQIIQLAPGGVAPVLSYNVPEPTSYSGRNFIDLALPDNYFRDDIPYEPNVPTQEETLARLKAIQASVRSTLARDGMVAATATHSSLVLPGGERVSAELARLDPAEVQAMREAGRELVIYRGMSGTLMHRWAAPVKYAPAARDPRILVGGGGGSGGTGATANMIVYSPANGASFSGPHTGATVTVTGRASTSSLGATVGASVGIVGVGMEYVGTGNQVLEWSKTLTIRTSGQVTIRADAQDSLGSTRTVDVVVNVTLAAPPDGTAPVVSFDSPAAGSVVTGTPAGATVQAILSASDAVGVQSVRVARQGDATWKQATRDAGTGRWGCSLTLPLGASTLNAEAFDAAGNRGTAQVALTVQTPDTTAPTVAITSPSAGAQVVGPFEGVDVWVTGTAADDRGVRRVYLKVDGEPTEVDAVPRAAGDWSQWSGTVRMTRPDTRVITAYCVDAAGNTGDASVGIEVVLVPEMVSRLNRIILVESYRLSSYLGNYGAGRTLKTFSLLPGEKTKLSIKTFTKTEIDAKQASSILDSYSDESSVDFETATGKEQANKANYDESSKYSVEGEAKASWGWGSAGVKAGTSGGTNRAREEFVKNISNATQKHVSKASARRDVQINTSYEVKETSGEETAVEREIENVNVSRTLNFVFRQMNQEFITLLHLVDVRLGFFKVVDVEGQTEPRYVYREFTLPEVRTLLEDTIVPEWRDAVRDAVVHQLTHIFDYREECRSFAEWRDIPGEGQDSRYLRVRRDLVSTYLDGATGTEIDVPGIILAANKYVLRTEGILAEAVLGQGEALDEYSHGLQDQAVEAKRLANSAARQQLRRNRLAMQIVAAKDEEAAQLFAQLFPAFPPAAEEDASPAPVPPGQG
ncbi:MAG: Ig-like domain-containing protein [Longimicrobiaceae bacterium]